MPGWAACFFAACILYALTANRGAQWQDSGWHILRIVSGELVHPLGLALSHPLHYWLGRAAISLPVLEPCLAITLVSAIAAAIAVANVYGCVLTLTSLRSAALIAATSLALAHTFWKMATLTETYTITAALLSGECWCLARLAMSRSRRAFSGMLLLNGLGLANHPLALLTLPVLVAVVAYALTVRIVRPRDVVVGLALWILGSLPYTALVAQQMAGSGEVVATLRSALFGRSFAGDVLNTHLGGRMLMISLGFIVLNFPNLLLPLSAIGLARGRTLGVPVLFRRALAAALLIHLLFVLRYSVVDQFAFFVPSYVLLSIFGGMGWAVVSRETRPRRRRATVAAAIGLLTLTPIVYAVAPLAAKRLGVLQSLQRHKPYRDDYVYLFAPWSIADRSAERMSREAVALAGENGVIVVEDDMASFAIRYRALRQGASEVTFLDRIEPAAVAAALRRGRPVVLVPRNTNETPEPPPNGRWVRRGDLYVLGAAEDEP